jgi:hypothetical protein
MSRQIAWCVTVLFVACLGTGMPVRAEDAPDFGEATSLRFIPADATFYVGAYRIGEQWQALCDSRAMQSLPAELQPQTLLGNFAPAQGITHTVMQFLDDVPELKSLLGEVCADELFVTAGKSGSTALLDKNNLLSAVFPDITLSVGGRVRDPRQAEAALLGLQTVLAAKLPTEGDYQFTTEVIEVAGQKRLLITVAIQNKPQAPPDKPAAGNSKLRLYLTVGLLDEYLVATGSISKGRLLTRPKGPKLYDSPAFAALRDKADQRIVSVVYHHNAARGPDKNAATNKIKSLIPNAQIANEVAAAPDLQKLAMQLLPTTERSLRFCWWTDTGYSGTTVQWGHDPRWDSSQPLALLEHVGDRPLFFSIARTAQRQQNYEFYQQTMLALATAAEAKLTADFNGEAMQRYQLLRARAAGFAEQINEITVKALLPALGNGETGLLLEADLESGRWFGAGPKSKSPARLLTPVFLCGVQDAAELEDALMSYGKVGNDAWDQLRTGLNLTTLPAWTANPRLREDAAGKLFWYPLPPALTLDPQVSPALSIGAHITVASISAEVVERRRKTETPKIPGPAGQLGKPLAAAAYYDWRGLADLCESWIAASQESGAFTPEAATKLQPALRLVRCMPWYSSATHRDGETMVYDFEWKLEDLPAETKGKATATRE